ncbi:hypothetical protein QE429_000268 [Bacillus sp. SORGH_AS 510]|uniref:hypothetical protein n=1 Tax=Bacillus sp. SORGH_AS_0510 TaxID=3041771 RepID=UPI002786AB22|nr:hypothetical protein [Bacillus sp. SORGH_AS_0510]MDQ1143441.1 hypothetical protein [Bacillus sp. SORGH_AS_0510]
MSQTKTAMSKVETMDHELKRYGKDIGYEEIRQIVHSVFDIDLETKLVVFQEYLAPLSIDEANTDIPVAKLVLEYYFNQSKDDLTGSQIRTIIKNLFGINLEGISSLAGAKISIYSKEQWITQHDHDLFVVDTPLGDADVRIYPTPYFTKKTGINKVPLVLQQALASLGYSYDSDNNWCYYSNPTGESVGHEFKVETIETIRQIILDSYQ